MEATAFRACKKSIETERGPVAYADVGTGPAALFVHGVFMNSLLWRNVIGQVSDLRRCVAVDLPAHGDTATEPSRDLSMSASAELLNALCDALDLGEVDLVANDTGGAVAQILAAEHPRRIRSMTLTNCDAHDNFPPEAFKAGHELALAGRLADFVQEMVNDPDLARSSAGLGLGYEDAAALSDDVVLGYLAPLVATPQRASEFNRFVTSSDAQMLLSIEEDLRRLDKPTLIVWGTGDEFFDVSWAHWLAEAIPGAREPVFIPGGKLFFVDERADEFVPHLRSHWSGTCDR